VNPLTDLSPLKGAIGVGALVVAGVLLFGLPASWFRSLSNTLTCDRKEVLAALNRVMNKQNQMLFGLAQNEERKFTQITQREEAQTGVPHCTAVIPSRFQAVRSVPAPAAPPCSPPVLVSGRDAAPPGLVLQDQSSSRGRYFCQPQCKLVGVPRERTQALEAIERSCAASFRPACTELTSPYVRQCVPVEQPPSTIRVEVYGVRYQYTVDPVDDEHFKVMLDTPFGESLDADGKPI
jgi:hypothetical protein